MQRERRSLAGVDRIRVVSAFLLFALGVMVILRSLSFGLHFLPVAVGTALLGIGLYRIYFYWRWLRERNSP